MCIDEMKTLEERLTSARKAHKMAIDKGWRGQEVRMEARVKELEKESAGQAYSSN